MLTQIDRFQDVHFHASSVRGWRQIYNQITPGTLQSSLMQVSAGRFHVFREHLNQRVVQQGEAPRGKVCFAIPLAVPGIAYMQGREADDKCVFVLRGGEEFMFHMPVGTDMLSLTFECEDCEQILSESPWPMDLNVLLKQPVLRVPLDRLAEGKVRLLSAFCEALANPHLVDTPEAEKQLEHTMLDALLGVITHPECDKEQRHESSPRSFIVEKIHRMTQSDANSPRSVLDLCERLRASRRAVQNSFRNVSQTTPVYYIRSIRLNGVRRDLMSTSVSEVSVGDAAAGWGFFHLSHFASDYKDLFGELPSHTKRSNIAKENARGHS